jgi:predicted transcriptional regulator
MNKSMISARIPAKLDAELEVIAQAKQRSKAFLITEALESYVDRQRWMQERVNAAIKDSDETGELISNEVVMTWLDSLGTDAPLPPPMPDVFRTPKTGSKN